MCVCVSDIVRIYVCVWVFMLRGICGAAMYVSVRLYLWRVRACVHECMCVCVYTSVCVYTVYTRQNLPLLLLRCCGGDQYDAVCVTSAPPTSSSTNGGHRWLARKNKRRTRSAGFHLSLALVVGPFLIFLFSFLYYCFKIYIILYTLYLILILFNF